MYRNILRNTTTLALGTLLLGSTLVLAGNGLQGEVRGLDGKGMATVHTTDGKDHQVKASDSFKVGTKVECEAKHNALECRVPAPHAAVTPAPAKTAPAPVASNATPAPSTVTLTPAVK